MKQKLTTSMLLIGALLIGAFIWFFERDSETSQQQELRNRTVFSVYPDTIRWIHMERGDLKIECTKTAGSWRMSYPADAPVNNAVVERMIASMASVERGELIRAETLTARNLTPAEYGFDEPRATITFQNNRGTFTWLIGRDAPLGERLYVMSSESGDIISVPQALLNLVPEDPAWIRDRTLFKSKAAAVRGIDLRRASGFLQLRQAEENGWMMVQPQTGRANRQRVHDLIEKIVGARIGKFVLDEPTDLTVYGLGDPGIELTLFTQDENSQTLLIGKTLPEQPEARYAKWSDSPSVFTVPAEWASEFELETTPLRNRQIVDEQLNQITRVMITSGEEQIDLLRTNDVWQIMRPARWDAEASSVRTVLETLSGSIITEFVNNPNTAQTERIQNAPWTITYTANGKTHTLTIGRPEEDDRILVRRDDETSLYLADQTLFDSSFADPLFYRSRTVLKIDPVEIKTITLKTGEEEFRVEKLDGQFAAADRAQKADSDVLAKLTDELAALRTGRFIAFNPNSLVPYGLETPTARLTITLNSTNVLGQVVLLGGLAADGRFAMLQGQPVVFILPEETVNTLTQKLTQPIEKQAEEIEQP